jgi:hypothetical protein
MCFYVSVLKEAIYMFTKAETVIPNNRILGNVKVS